MANNVDPDQTLFAYVLNLSVMLGYYLQQTTSADGIFRYIFSWRFKGNLGDCVFIPGKDSDQPMQHCN